MSNIQTGAEGMPRDLYHRGFLGGQIGRIITISTTPVIAGDSFEMDAVGALRLSTLRRGLAIDSTVDIFTFYVPHRHVYGEQWIKFMKDGVNATPLPTVNTTGYIDHVFFSSRRRHTRLQGDWSSDVCSSDLRRIWTSSSRSSRASRRNTSGRSCSAGRTVKPRSRSRSASRWRCLPRKSSGIGTVSKRRPLASSSARCPAPSGRERRSERTPVTSKRP